MHPAVLPILRWFGWQPGRIATYRVLSALSSGKGIYLCEAPDGRRVVLKPAGKRRVLHAYNRMRKHIKTNKFRILRLPQYVGTTEGFDVFDYIDGRTEPWSEKPDDAAFGGRLISEKLIGPILDLSGELDALKVRGDFYWRNFVFTPKRTIAMVDWERISRCDTAGPRLAYLYCLMFANRPWQLQFVDEAKARGVIAFDDFRRQVIAQARQFGVHWARKAWLRQIMLETIEEVSNPYRYNAIWNGVDLPALLETSGYHVFDDLGQAHARDSQIDGPGKLAALALDRVQLKGKKLLDIGCNFGWFLKEYVKAGAAKIVGIDINPKNCAAAKLLMEKVYGFTNVTVAQADVLKYGGAGFDIVVSTSMFHYIADKPAFLQRIASFLSRGGVLVLETPLSEGPDDETREKWGHVTVRIPTKSYVEALAASAFDAVYFGPSNRPERRVFHFRKR